MYSGDAVLSQEFFFDGCSLNFGGVVYKPMPKVCDEKLNSVTRRYSARRKIRKKV